MIEYIDEDIKEVMEITKLNYQKAEKLFKEVAKDIDDGYDDEIYSYDVIDVIKTEQKVKDNGLNKIYAQSEKPRAKSQKPKTIKISDEKKGLFNNVLDNLKAEYGENVKILKENKLISIKINDIVFKIDIIQTRNKKK